MNRRRKSGFSREQHFALGAQLASMEAVLHRAILDSSHVYAVTGREVRALEAASRAIDRARSVLDDAICRERPLSDLKVIDAYYPREAAGPQSIEVRCPTCPTSQNQVGQK